MNVTLPTLPNNIANTYSHVAKYSVLVIFISFAKPVKLTGHLRRARMSKDYYSQEPIKDTLFFLQSLLFYVCNLYV